MNPRLRSGLPLLTTAGIFLLLCVIGGANYPGLISAGVGVNVLTDNAALGICAVGMSLVIFSGGIDLSVGAVQGFTSIFVAALVENHGVHPALAAVTAIAVGTALGAGMGALIHWFRQPAFLITLAGMFLMRGCAYWISTDSIPLANPLCTQLAGFELQLGALYLRGTALALVAVLFLGWLVAHHTRFGRNLLAIGSSEQSALLMGLPVGSTKVAVYALNGACAALAGLVATLNESSGSASLGVGLELNAIAVVVIGGTILTGGRGHLLGTVLGLFTFGLIQQAILFDGRLSSEQNMIVVGLLLLGFILLQRFLVVRLSRK